MLVAGILSIARISPEDDSKNIKVQFSNLERGEQYNVTFPYPNWVTQYCNCDTTRVVSMLKDKKCTKKQDKINSLKQWFQIPDFKKTEYSITNSDFQVAGCKD